jgi:thiopeptide-type bacteriocin biosynthesis protein
LNAIERKEKCLYAVLESPPESHDRLLMELIAPVVREMRSDENLHSLFFVRYADPAWQLRFRVLGRPGWIDDVVRPRIESAIRPFSESGVIHGIEYGAYAREWERYGGPRGMELAERIFFYDSVACLELVEAEARGLLGKSRREYSLMFTERFLDLFRFDGSHRRQFYLEGHTWAFRDGVFREEDRPRLERQYDGVRNTLREWLRGPRAEDPAIVFGGPEPARIAASCLEAMRPVAEELLAAHADGSIRQGLVYLAWSYAHLHCNRLGIDLVPEAILRYLMFRAYEELPGPSS